MDEATEKTPLEPPSAANELATLRQCWPQWTRLVELYASNSRLRLHVDHGEYRRIHRRLLQCCRTLAKTEDPAQASFYESLEDLAKPWMSPRILNRTEPRFLADQLRFCHRIEKQLTGRIRSPRRGLRMLLTVVGVFATAVAVLFAASRSRYGSLMIDGVRSGSATLYHAALATTIGQRLVLGGLSVAIATIYIASRARRS